MLEPLKVNEWEQAVMIQSLLWGVALRAAMSALRLRSPSSFMVVSTGSATIHCGRQGAPSANALFCCLLAGTYLPSTGRTPA